MGVIKEFLDKINQRQISVAVIGDAMVDEYYYVKVRKISPEFPIPVMHSDEEGPAYSLPGGAANVAYQFQHFNADVKLAAFVDQDARRVFEKAGLDLSRSLISSELRIPRKRRFYSDDFPTYRWDVEQHQYGVKDIKKKCFQLYERQHECKPDVVIFSDYDKGVFTEYLHLLIGEVPVTIVDPKNHLDRWKGCTIFKPNSTEASRLVEKIGRKSDRSDEQALALKEYLRCKSVVITRGGAGVVGAWNQPFKLGGKDMEGQATFEYAPPKMISSPDSVIGAGDCFMAFLAMAVGCGLSIPQAAEVAFLAGSLYVQSKHNEPITPARLLSLEDPVAAKFVTIEDLHKAKGSLVFTNGCFDILHSGHIQTLQFAKSKGDKLVVAVNSDESVSRLKPGRPIMPLSERMRVVAALDCVDYVISFKEDTPREIIGKVKPDVLVKGGDYKPEEIVGAALVPQVYVAPLVEGISTTNILKKIKPN